MIKCLIRGCRLTGQTWVWCGVVWCGVVWCGVVWCGVGMGDVEEGASLNSVTCKPF